MPSCVKEWIVGVVVNMFPYTDSHWHIKEYTCVYICNISAYTYDFAPNKEDGRELIGPTLGENRLTNNEQWNKLKRISVIQTKIDVMRCNRTPTHTHVLIHRHAHLPSITRTPNRGDGAHFNNRLFSFYFVAVSFIVAPTRWEFVYSSVRFGSVLFMYNTISVRYHAIHVFQSNLRCKQ